MQLLTLSCIADTLYYCLAIANIFTHLVARLALYYCLVLLLYLLTIVNPVVASVYLTLTNLGKDSFDTLLLQTYVGRDSFDKCIRTYVSTYRL